MRALLALLSLCTFAAAQSPSILDESWHAMQPAASVPAAPPLRSQAQHEGIWSVTFENDIFADVDTNYSSGFAISFTGGESGGHDPDSLYHRVLERVSWLPGIGGEDREHFVGFTLGQTMFTPEDITLPTPPPDDRPYAGFLFFNTSFFSRDRHSMDAWTVQLGLAGPSSLAEQSQKFIHDVIGSDEPQGWDHQLKDELIVNLHYEHSRRLLSERFLDELDADLIPKVGAGLGNFATYANLGVVGRVGSNMPDTFSGNSLTAGLASNAPALVPAAERWGWSLFAGAQGYWLGHFLPLDGNTFTDGPRVGSRDLIGSVLGGLSVGCSTFVTTLSYTAFSETFEGQRERSEFGAVTVSWSR